MGGSSNEGRGGVEGVQKVARTRLKIIRKRSVCTAYAYVYMFVYVYAYAYAYVYVM